MAEKIKMSEYLECHNFFMECRSILNKHEHFLSACRKLSSYKYSKDVDPNFIDVMAKLYIEIKRGMENICDEHKCIIYDSETDEDMESEISDLCNSDTDKSDTDESDTDESNTDGSNTDDTDVSDEEEEDDKDEDDEEGENDDEEQEENKDTDDIKDKIESESEENSNEDNNIDYEDVIDLFTSNHCCIKDIIEPFFNAMVEQKNEDIIRKIQKYDDEYEESCIRYTKWFNSHEKEECATILTEILSHYNIIGTKFFKVCPSNYIKLFAVCCRDSISSNLGEKLIGSSFEKIINDSFPLNKKRKLFTKKDIMEKLMKYVKDKTMPKVHRYLGKRTKYILSKAQNT